MTFFQNPKQNKFLWDLLVAFVATYISIYLPVQIAFNQATGFLPSINIGWVSAIFMVDIFVQIYYLRTIKKSVVWGENPRKAYFQFLFWVDLIAAIPWGWLVGLPVWHLLKLIKMFRIWQFVTRIRQNSLLHSTAVLSSVFLYWFLVSAHWLSCGWLAINKAATTSDMTTTYVDAFYWCITTLTAVGYGDITPTGSIQKLYAVVVQILGVGIYGYLIGNIASMISRADPAQAQYQQNMEQLASLLHFRKLPGDLQYRIKEYYQYLWKRRLGFDENQLLNSLPPALREEVSVELKHDLIETFPLFKDADPAFISAMSQALRPVIATPDETIFAEGSHGDAMFFVVQGSLDVHAGNDKRVMASIGGGSFFGEIALVSNQPRTASVVANTYCDLYRLSKVDFDATMKRFPEIAKEIANRGKVRFERDSGSGKG